jgi:hypothetical protein
MELRFELNTSGSDTTLNYNLSQKFKLIGDCMEYLTEMEVKLLTKVVI